MKRSAIAAVGLSLAVLAGCGQTSEPSPPPTSEAALSTPSDDSEVTSEAPTTEAVTEEPEADGPPEMPEEAMEQTEAGAEAFALHYIDLINYTGMHPETGLLEPLAADDCESCANHEETVKYSAEHSELLKSELWSADTPKTAIFTGDDAVIHVTVDQASLEVLNASGDVVDETTAGTYELIFDLEAADPWLIKSIKVSE